MKVKWTVCDGYVGGSRPQFTDIDDGDLDECETDEEREEFINDCIQ